MQAYKTEQEQFWAGQFGDEYSIRNEGSNWIASNLALFSKIFSRTQKISSVIEFGANIGLNLQAIRQLLPHAEIDALEINNHAANVLKELRIANSVYQESILEFEPSKSWDFALIKGVLIHINPDYLDEVYKVLVNSTDRYLCVVEYYNPTPVEVTYRGHDSRLFKRDFARRNFWIVTRPCDWSITVLPIIEIQTFLKMTAPGFCWRKVVLIRDIYFMKWRVG